MKTRSLIKISISILTLSLLAGCGSTSPSKGTNLSKNQAHTPNFTQQDILLFDQAIEPLIALNQSSENWADAIKVYSEQKNANATSKYVTYSSELHASSPSLRCNLRGITSIKNALAHHPSSIPVLSYALACAERYERKDQQELIAQSIGMIADELLKNSAIGDSKSSPMLVRELYEGEYILGLAGIEVYETEMLVEDDRLLILHHGIDQISNQYSLSFADQSDFFMHSFRSSMSKAGVKKTLPKSELVGIKQQTLLDGKHYSMVLWDIRQQLYSGEYLEVIKRIKENDYTTPSANAMLAQAYMASNSATGIKEIEDSLIYYANLGIPESQAVSAMMLLKMTDEKGTDFSEKRRLDGTEALKDISLIVNSFKKSAAIIGLDNASLVWTRTLLGDEALGEYLHDIVSQLDANSIVGWQNALTYIQNSQKDRSIEFNKRIARFNTALSNADKESIAFLQGRF
jgi:hypothetical protein